MYIRPALATHLMCSPVGNQDLFREAVWRLSIPPPSIPDITTGFGLSAHVLSAAMGQPAIFWGPAVAKTDEGIATINLPSSRMWLNSLGGDDFTKYCETMLGLGTSQCIRDTNGTASEAQGDNKVYWWLYPRQGDLPAACGIEWNRSIDHKTVYPHTAVQLQTRLSQFSHQRRVLHAQWLIHKQFLAAASAAEVCYRMVLGYCAVYPVLGTQLGSALQNNQGRYEWPMQSGPVMGIVNPYASRKGVGPVYEKFPYVGVRDLGLRWEIDTYMPLTPGEMTESGDIVIPDALYRPYLMLHES